jgi:hypothetical protein
MAMGLGLDENHFVDKYISDPFWVIRIIGTPSRPPVLLRTARVDPKPPLSGYPPLATSEGNQEVGISCGEHTDYGCLTILNQVRSHTHNQSSLVLVVHSHLSFSDSRAKDSTRGALQVQQKDGQWLNANPIPGAFVMNIGDMIEVCACAVLPLSHAFAVDHFAHFESSLLLAVDQRTVQGDAASRHQHDEKLQGLGPVLLRAQL